MTSALPTGFLGTQLDDRYRLDHLIGEGATAWVFAGHDVRLARDVAVKLLKPDGSSEQEEPRRRFVLEGQTLAKLVHPNIVPVYDAGVTREGFGFLIMELCQAGTLETELFRRKRLAAKEAVELLLPLLGALSCAHASGVVHRDIKPANIVLASENGQRCAKLLDFGIARRADSGSTDSASGTPSYMAPEQAAGRGPTAAADVWSMGVVFYRCLSGGLPFAGETHLVALQKLVSERAPRFAEVCPGLGAYLAIALDRALERSPERRYRDMRSFAQALEVACAQDGILLASRTRLESLGLAPPNAHTIRTEVEITRPIGELARVSVVARLSSRVPRTVRTVVLAGALALLSLGVFYVSRGQQTLREPPIAHAQAHTPLPSRILPTVVEPQALREVEQADISLRSTFTPVLVTPPSTKAATRAIKRLRPSTRASAAQVAPLQAVMPTPPAQAATPSSGLVTNWDW